ncbi:hypothetical protein QQP08_018613 [Theobroma cacao]|nr:hypothetical protein QQP08_018613 [Theobroma cacao]
MKQRFFLFRTKMFERDAFDQFSKPYLIVLSFSSILTIIIKLICAATMFCYCRLTYMPMSYLYGRKFVGPITPLILQLREELHIEPYNEINWRKKRHLCAKEDLHYPHTMLQILLWDSLYIFTDPLLNCWPFNKLREKALKVTMNHIHYEDDSSQYITVGCVKKPLCMLVCRFEDPNGVYFKKHLARIADYVWNKAAVWDASLTLQALLASKLSDEIGPILIKGHSFLKNSQMTLKECLDTFLKNHGLFLIEIMDSKYLIILQKCCLYFAMMPLEMVGEKMELEQFYDSVNVILSLQSENGGLSAWEPAGVEFLEDLVKEYEYVECTSSSIQALDLFQKLYPEHKKREIANFMSKAAQFLEETQYLENSW